MDDLNVLIIKSDDEIIQFYEILSFKDSLVLERIQKGINETNENKKNDFLDWFDRWLDEAPEYLGNSYETTSIKKTYNLILFVDTYR